MVRPLVHRVAANDSSVPDAVGVASRAGSIMLLTEAGGGCVEEDLVCTMRLVVARAVLRIVTG